MHDALLTRVRAADPVALAVAAPEGFGKRRFVRRLSPESAPLAVAHLHAMSRAETFGTILGAIATVDAPFGDAVASDRLAGGRDVAAELVRAWWASGAAPIVLMLIDHDVLPAAPVADVVTELTNTASSQRRIALVTRHERSAPAFPSIIRHADLLLDAGASDELACDWNISSGLAERVIAAARGVPLAAATLACLAEQGDAVAVERATRILDGTDGIAFAIERTLEHLGGTAIDALHLIAALGSAAQSTLTAGGEPIDRALLTILRRLPFVEAAATTLRVHPAAERALDERYRHRRSRALANAVERARTAGSIVAACEIALAAGEAGDAAALADATDPGALPLALWERIVDRLDRADIPRHAGVWLATIPHRRFEVDRATYVHEAHVAFRCLPHNAPPKRRADVLMHLASAERTGGRPQDARALLDEGLATFAADRGEARAALLTMIATLDGVEGRFGSARVRMAEAAALVRSDFFDDLALHYIDVHESFFRGRRADGFIVLDEVLRRSLARGTPLFAAYAAMNAAIFAWASGDDRRTADAIATLADLLTPGLQRGFAPIIDAFHGRPASGGDDLWPVHAAIADLFACGAARTPADALAAARRALRAASDGGDPYLQMLAAAAGVILGDRTLDASLERTVMAVESPEARDAVRRLLAGDDDPGLLAPLVRRLGHRSAAPPRLRVEVLSGNLVRDGSCIELRDKERELVVFLAVARSAATVEAIGEALWPHVAEDAWPNNMKVTLSRLRAKCAGIPIVESHAGRYRLAPTVDVDLRALESMLRALPAAALPAPAVHATLTAACAPFLQGTAATFERYAWIDPSLVRIRELVCTMAAVLARAALAAGDAATALAYADVMLALDEYREDAIEFAVRADAMRGDPAGANARIRRFLATLREAGLEPTERIERLAAVPIA